MQVCAQVQIEARIWCTCLSWYFHFTFWGRISHWPWGSLIQLDWLVNESQDPFVSTSPVRRCMPPYLPTLEEFSGLRIKCLSSHSYIKLLTKKAISPFLFVGFLMLSLCFLSLGVALELSFLVLVLASNSLFFSLWGTVRYNLEYWTSTLTPPTKCQHHSSPCCDVCPLNHGWKTHFVLQCWGPNPGPCAC